MNKLASIITIVVLVTTQGYSIQHPPFEEGQHLYVVAQAGLSMRAEAHAGGELITIIPYGELVQVLEHSDSLHTQRIEWVDGHWTPVHYEGHVGYVFDGYLSALSLPIHEFEKTQEELDLIYPLESWVGVHLHELGSPDTVITDYYDQVTQVYEGGDKLTRMNAGNLYKLKLSLKDVRLMDAYHLLKSMLSHRYEVDLFQQATLYLASEDDHLTRIKVQLDNPIDIRYERDGQVLITITSQEYECQLLTQIDHELTPLSSHE